MVVTSRYSTSSRLSLPSGVPRRKSEKKLKPHRKLDASSHVMMTGSTNMYLSLVRPSLVSVSP
jgi:hypothetical protein